MAVNFLSPSALGTWQKNPEEYFTKYLSASRPPRMPQTAAMAVGSSFDCYVKAHLYERVYGADRAQKDLYTFDDLYTKAVEPHNFDTALKQGMICFEAYRKSGALHMLYKLIDKSPKPPVFEYSLSSVKIEGVNGLVCRIDAPDGVVVESTPVVLMGKPDMTVWARNGSPINLDWKVNGYMSASGQKPVPGYFHLHNPGEKNHNSMHKECHMYSENGFDYNMIPHIEQRKPDWGQQLATYSWLTGVPVGETMYVAVDQLAVERGKITVATHRCEITKAFQLETYRNYQRLWDNVNSDWFFRHMPKDASQQRAEILMQQGQAYEGGDSNSEWLKSIRGK